MIEEKRRLLLLGLIFTGLGVYLFILSPTNTWSAERDDMLTIQRLHVQVMPEFDDPRVLVIVQGKLALTAEDLPREVTFRVPQGAQINQMASLDMLDGTTEAHRYETRPDPEHEGWILVSYHVENTHFFYEYYYDSLEGAVEKTFDFTLQPFYPIDDVQIEVQQPRQATDFEIDREPTAIRAEDALGFTHYRFNLGALHQEERTTLTIRYIKTNPRPSLTQEDLMAMQMGMGTSRSDETAAQAASLPTADTSSTSKATLPLLGFLALIIVIGLYRYERSTAQATHVPDKQTVLPGYCTHCGVALKPKARFCHGCGTSLAPTPDPSASTR